jgi:hypothetical protein
MFSQRSHVRRPRDSRRRQRVLEQRLFKHEITASERKTRAVGVLPDIASCAG